ncbi:MAG: amidohydrolase [Gammaproteobacteria bacterium]
MKILALIILGAAALLSGCAETPQNGAAPAESTAEIADVVYTNGRIYTVSESQPWADAVAVKNGRFLVVGSNGEVEGTVGESTQVIDLEGQFVMPGIVDLHVHPWATVTFNTINLDFSDPYDTEAMLQEIQAFADANTDKQWIRGGSWGVGHFPDDHPRKELLDEIVPDRPVVLIDQTGHNYWVNSKALELAGIDADTPTDKNYIIEKDPVTGEPTGTVRESAMRLIEQVAEWPTLKEYYPVLQDAFQEFNSLGVTSMRTAEGSTQWLDVTQAMEQAGDLDMRLFIGWDWRTHITTPYTNEEMDEQITNRAKYDSELVKPNFVKIFLDGTPGGYEAAFVEPYSDGSGEYGKTKFTTSELTDIIARFDKQGVGTFMHAVADGTARHALDAIEAVREKNGDSGVRHCVAHLVWVHPDDIPRFASIPGVTAELSPPVPYPNNVFNAFLTLVGQERVDRMFPAGSLVRAGARPGFGTDWLTVLTPSPWVPMQTMVTRINPDEPELGELGQNETVTVEEVVRIFTINGAYTVMAEDQIGSIETGKNADMIVLDRNLIEIDPMTISEIKVLKTVMGGRTVFERGVTEVKDVVDESDYEDGGRLVH